MKIDRRLVWAAPFLALLAFGFGMRKKLAATFAGEDSPAAATPTSVVALYEARPTRPVSPDSMGVHVADVGVGPKGAWLLEAGDPKIGEALKAALAELAARPFLPALEEGGEGGDATLGAKETKPGDAQYAWAVAGFLRERTGLKYDVRPYVKPKTP
jgi:hypothetical protein